jgi:hypothetical protein
MFGQNPYLMLQGGLVGTMTGNCLFYDIIGMHFSKLTPKHVNHVAES